MHKVSAKSKREIGSPMPSINPTLVVLYTSYAYANIIIFRRNIFRVIVIFWGCIAKLIH